MRKTNLNAKNILRERNFLVNHT